MKEKNVEELIRMLREAAYIPRDWEGVSERKVIDLNTALKFINLLRDERY